MRSTLLFTVTGTQFASSKFSSSGDDKLRQSEWKEYLEPGHFKLRVKELCFAHLCQFAILAAEVKTADDIIRKGISDPRISHCWGDKSGLSINRMGHRGVNNESKE